jgi:hypothetical protein
MSIYSLFLFEFLILNFSLIIIYLIVSSFLSFKMIMVILNYSLGYANEQDKTICPPILFWALYSWIPLWGPVCSLLYLSRSQLGRKSHRSKYGPRRIFSVDPNQAAASAGAGMSNQFHSPLIGPTDDDSYLLHDSNGLFATPEKQQRRRQQFRRINSNNSNSDNYYNDAGSPAFFRSPMDQSRSYGKFLQDELASDTSDPNDLENNNNNNANNNNNNNVRSSNKKKPQYVPPEDFSINSSSTNAYPYRDTSVNTNHLPSDLNFANIIRNNRNSTVFHHHDFSYRGEEEHNGQYR